VCPRCTPVEAPGAGAPAPLLGRAPKERLLPPLRDEGPASPGGAPEARTRCSQCWSQP